METGNYGSVRRYLNGVTSREWSLNAVVDLLKNEVYRGVQKFGQWRNEAAHPPLVSEELWEAVRKKDVSRARTPKQDPVDKSSFYLRSLIHCGHCGGKMTPANHHGRTARVRYYECICDGKRTSACPVKRVNANSVHDALLAEIRRAAEHPTRMNEIIREAVKVMPTADKSADLLAGVTRCLREAEKKVKNVTTAIEPGGGAVRSLVNRLEELEAERLRLSGEQGQLERRIAESRLQRPDTAQVQAHWGGFLAIWDVASEEERAKLLPLIVERVELTEKERGFCRLVFQPEIPLMEEVGEIQATLKLFPNSTGLYADLSTAWLELSNVHKAEFFARKAVFYGPRSGEAHTALGELLLASGRISDGVKELHEAISLNPNLPYPYLMLSMVLAREKPINASESWAYLAKALSVDPSVSSTFKDPSANWGVLEADPQFQALVRPYRTNTQKYHP